MSGWRLYLSAGCFVGITVLKLLFPAHTETLRENIVSVIDMDMDYTETIQTMGELLTKDAVQEVIQRIGYGNVVQAVNGDEMLPLPTAQCIEPTAEPVYVEEETVEETASSPYLQQAIAAFLMEQEAYAAYEVPETVTYEGFVLPFAYGEPVHGVCSSGFGYRVHPIENQVLFHYGTDYEVVEGTAVNAFADGQVSAVGEEAGYGKYIEISHSDGWKTLYAHCSEILVNVSETVKIGETIALSGQTGRVTGPHLHLELTHNGMYTNPEFYFYDSNE